MFPQKKEHLKRGAIARGDASLPAPNLTKMLISSADSENYTPVVGYESSIDTSGMSDTNGDGYIDDTYVAVSETSLEESTASVTRRSSLVARGMRATSHESRATNWLIPSAQATSITVTEDGSTTTNYCTMDGVTTAQIAIDGSFEAYPTGTNSSTFYIYTTDCESLSEVTTDSPNTALIWFADETIDITPIGAGTDNQEYFYSLTDDTGVSIMERDGTFAVQNSYLDRYRAFDAPNASRLAYANNTLGLLEENTGISLFSSLFDTSLNDWISTDSGTDTTVPYTQQYTVIKKTTKGDVWFGRKPSEEYWNYADYDNVFRMDYTTDKEGNQDYTIKIYDDDNTAMSTYDFGQMITFDMDANKVALAVFTGADGNYRLSMGYYDDNIANDFEVVGGATAFNAASYNFKDIVIIKEQSGATTSATQSGNFLILDSQNKVVWIKKYFANYMGTSSDSFTETLSSSISVGNGATNIALDADKKTAFVLNATDNTITAFRVRNNSGRVLTASQMESTKQTIDLSGYLNGKSVSLSAVKVIYQSTASGNYLMVSTPGIKGAMVFEAPSIDL